MNPMKCPKCPSGKKGQVDKFRSRADVIKHLKKGHNLDFYFCVQCQDEFENKDVHQKFHITYPHHCQYCPKVFKSTSNLFMHMQQDHQALLGLHSRLPGVTIKTDKLPCRGEELLNRAKNIGLHPDIQLVSKDYFVVGKEGNLPKVTIHAVTPRGMMRGEKVSMKSWPNALRRPQKHIGHLCTASDFCYDEDAHFASYDELNYVYLDPSLNRDQLGSLEKFVNFILSGNWNEILTITAVNYGREEREASEIGKAYLMTRDGEPPRILCYSFPNNPSSSSSFTRRKITLQKFREDFNLPNLFADLPDVKECGEETVYNCKWLRCTSAFLSSSGRDQHQKVCPIRNDPKAQLRQAVVRNVPVPCLHCKVIAQDNAKLASHISSMHSADLQQSSYSSGSKTTIQSNPNQNMRKRKHSDSPKLEATLIQTTAEPKLKIIQLIELHPLSRKDIDEVMEVLINKKPVDGVD